MKKIISILILMGVSSVTLAALQAQNNFGAVSVGTGGAGVASVDLVDGALINSATIPFYPQKQISFSYSSSRFSGAMVDNGREALFPAAIAYEQQSNDFYKKKNYHLILGYAVTSTFSLGLDFHYDEFRFLNVDEIHRQTLVNAGVFWQIAPAWGLGLTHRDVALTDTNLADTIDHVAITTLGVTYSYKNMAQFRFDVEKVEKQPSDRYIFKAGLESYINEWIVTRFGYRNDNIASMNFASAGLGFVGPQFGLHYAYQVEANNTVDPLHVIDLNFPF